MNKLKTAINSLLNALSDDPDDYPDSSIYLKIHDMEQEVRDALNETNYIKVIAAVRDGNVQGARGTAGVDFEVFDVDNKKAEGMSDEEIDEEWEKITEGLEAIY